MAKGKSRCRVRRPDPQEPDREYLWKHLDSNAYGDVRVESVVPTKHVLADEGSYYTVVGGGPDLSSFLQYNSGTVGMLPPSSFAKGTGNAMFAMRNTSSFISPRRVYLDYIKIIQIAVSGTVGTSVQCVIGLSTLIRQPSSISVSGTLTPTTPNMDESKTSVVNWTYITGGSFAGNVVDVDDWRYVGRCQLKGGPVLVGDEFSIVFGAVDQSAAGGYLVTPGAYANYAPPVIFGPGTTMMFHLWLPGSSGSGNFQYQIEAGWWER